jgi:hypothetical protein
VSTMQPMSWQPTTLDGCGVWCGHLLAGHTCEAWVVTGLQPAVDLDHACTVDRSHIVRGALALLTVRQHM